MSVKINQFSGIAPKISPHLLSGDMAVTANNCRVDRGSLRAIKSTTSVASVPNTANSIYYYEPSAMWLYWNTAGIKVARSPVVNDAYDRIYYTGDAYPQYTYQTRPAGGVPNGYKLGIPAPGNAPTLGKTGTATGTPSDRYYVFCYVSPLGEEGPPSPPSAVLSMTDTETATLSFTADSLGAYNLGTGAKRRIYRTAQGTTETTYQFVKDVPIETLSTTDNLLDVSLGEILPSTYWQPPPATLQGLTNTPNGFLVGFDGNTLYPSEAFLPHAWNANNAIAFDGDITAIAVTGDSIVVFTKRTPYLVTGTSPDSLSAIKIDFQQTCSSPASIVDMGGFVVFASPDGLCSVSANDMQLITQNFFTRDQWQSYSPNTMRGFFYEGMYVAFSSTKAFLFDPRNEPSVLTEITGLSFLTGYNDLVNDLLYLLHDNGSIHSWETGAGLSATWKSAPLRLSQAVCPAALRAYSTGSFTFQLFADGASVFGPVTVSNDTVKRLPSGYKAKEFQIQLQLSGSVEIQSIAIANSIEELS